MSRGRKPLPTGVSTQRGKRAKSELIPTLPAPPPLSADDCPDHLDEEGRAEWERMVRRLAAWCPATVLDVPALAIYCAAWSRHVRCEAEVRASESVETSAQWADAASKAAQTALKALAEFGMTPSNRLRMRATAQPGQAVNGGDPLAAFAQAK